MKPISHGVRLPRREAHAFGTYGGSLKDQSATDLGVHAAKAALAQAGVKPEDIDNVVFGNGCRPGPGRDSIGPPRGLKGRCCRSMCRR